MDNNHKIDSAISGKRLEDFEGLPMIYQHIKCPPFVTNRRTFFSTYEWAEGEVRHCLNTSQGNEKFVEDNKKLLEKDVLCTLVVGYSRMTARSDGTGVDILEVICVDIGGSLPDMIKKQIAKSNS